MVKFYVYIHIESSFAFCFAIIQCVCFSDLVSAEKMNVTESKVFALLVLISFFTSDCWRVHINHHIVME